MNPSVYLYRETEEGYELYLGEYSTLDGLALISPNVKVELIEAGATNYKKFGWATENELPIFSTVKEVVEFLKNERELGLIHFELILNDIGKLRTHDDGECHFTFKKRAILIDYIKSVTPQPFQNLILSELLNNSGLYITIDSSGLINKFFTFDQYLENNK